MNVIHPTSLSATLDAASEAFFFQKPLTISQCEEITALIISRQVQSGSNSGFFIPFTAESEAQTRLFSGEPLYSEFAHRHNLVIESSRLLKILNVENPLVDHAIQVSEHRMKMMCYSKFCSKGECKALTVSYLRYLSLNPSADTAAQINSHLDKLAGQRDGKGSWGGFPFFSTLLMLVESADPLAKNELEYAVPYCEKQFRKNWPENITSKRKQTILTKALARS